MNKGLEAWRGGLKQRELESCDEGLESCNENFGPLLGRRSWGKDGGGGVHVDKVRALSAGLD